MPVTFQQGIESNIYDSVSAYIKTNIATPYNAQVVNSPYPNPLGIIVEMPDDPNYVPILPLVVMNKLTDYKGPESLGVGDGNVWKYFTIRFNVYPALSPDQKPVMLAESILRNYFDYALGTVLYIPVYDYQTPGAPQVDALQVMNARKLKSTTKADDILNIQRNRFDYLLDVRLAYAAISNVNIA
jgi:hypothetical protein